MVAELAIYTTVHQPRRLKLPAQPVPRGASIADITRCLFDERLNERAFTTVARESYYPAARMFLELVRQGLHLSIGISLSFLRQAEAWDTDLLNLFRELVAEENVELIGVEPYHSLLFLLDLPAFVLRMQWMADEVERILGKRPTVADTTEMCMSAPIYNALDTAGFRGALMDGRSWVLEWRASTYLYRYSDELPYAQPIAVKRSLWTPRSKRAPQKLLVDNERTSGPYLLARHTELSEDVSARFSYRSWSNYPLFADSYAQSIAQTEGDFLLLGWDFATFGTYQRGESGIFNFMRALPGELARRGIETMTPGEVIDRNSENCNVYHLPLPVFPSTSAGNGGMESLLGSSEQQTLFQLMGYTYNTAKLTENPDLLDLAIWLMQSDNVQPDRWRGQVDAHTVLAEEHQVYLNLLQAMEPYLPARLIRRSRQKGTARVPRRRAAGVPVNSPAYTYYQM